LTLSAQAKAGFIFYDITPVTFAGPGAGTLTGTITTDGVLGSVASTNITAWQFTFTPAGGGGPMMFSGTTLQLSSDFMTASADTLTLNDDGVGQFVFSSTNPDFNFSTFRPSTDPPELLLEIRTAAGNGTDPFPIDSPYVFATAESSAAPEPASVTLALAGLAGLAGYRLMRRRRSSTA
jgi:MYXO-CTERM domain-containing protein